MDRQRIRARLGVLIAHPPPGSNPITITPQMAEVMLERNLDNRPLSPMHVESLAKEMGKNAWLMNGQSIVFADDGRLNDGQHRLHACIRANAPFASDVRFGVPRESFGVTDRGRKRTAGDIFAINGVKNHKMVAAATALIWRYTEGRMLHGASVTPSPVELYAYYSERPDIEQSVTFGHLFKRLAPPSVMMALHYVSEQQCRELDGEFFTKTATGVGILRGKKTESRMWERRIDKLRGQARLFVVVAGACKNKNGK